jgi:membrane-associated phospholipid phosphatase
MMTRDWKTYGYWAGIISMLFVPMYPLCNWISTQRTDTLALYVPWELTLPFIPAMIWAYFSMYVLFFLPPFLLSSTQLTALGKQLFWGIAIAGVTYIVLPSKLGFAREVPDDVFYGLLYTKLFSIDQPHNMVPSLHIVFTTLLTTAFANASSTIGRKLFFYAWLVLIAASTVLVHQHHLLDVSTGFLVAVLLRRVFRGRKELANRHASGPTTAGSSS